MSRTLSVVLTLAVIVVASAVLLVALSDSGQSPSHMPPDGRIPIAVFGDSDSHSFHDREYFQEGSTERGGEYRSVTFNWPEMLVRLRGNQVDLGEWRVWGPHKPIAKARELLGLPVRRPRKEDYQYNFAISGAGCKDLNEGWKQVDRFLSVMAPAPDRWHNGIVIIRIGVNDFAQSEYLDEFAKDPRATRPEQRIRFCLQEIELAVDRLLRVQPKLRIVLVGIFDNTNWAKKLERWQSPTALANIAEGLDGFDAALRQLAMTNANIAFFDDRAWFRRHWGSRDVDGKPAYHAVQLGNGFLVKNSVGDHPSNAVLADGHAGTVWNGLWCSSLIDLLDRQFGTTILPLDTAEVASFLERTARDSNIEL